MIRLIDMNLEQRFDHYCEYVMSSLSHADRVQPARWYMKGLMLPGKRKSVEPMAARVQPDRVRSAHQSMHHLVADAAWCDSALMSAVAEQVLPTLTAYDGPLHWIIDDTGFPKKGKHRHLKGPASNRRSTAPSPLPLTATRWWARCPG